MALQSKFRNVPRPRVFVCPPDDIRCYACNEPHIHLFRNNGCTCILCGPCWQKSSYAPVSPTENQCIKCNKPTSLRCYLDYWKFIAVNQASMRMFIIPELFELIQTSPLFCSVEDCGFSGPLMDTIIHERICYKKKPNIQPTKPKYTESVEKKKQQETNGLDVLGVTDHLNKQKEKPGLQKKLKFTQK